MRIIASNKMARNSVVDTAINLSLPVMLNQESLYGDVAQSIANVLKAASPGIYLWGGEPTIILPPDPGYGGRNQSLALAIALLIQGCKGITVLVAGTDGSDGPTNNAGAIIDGPTNTNVMDLAIAIVY
jgi:glycerate 2-kinase